MDRSAHSQNQLSHSVSPAAVCHSHPLLQERALQDSAACRRSIRSA